MVGLSAQDLIEKYLNFFAQKRHQIIPSAPLIPQDDASALFISAGMHPLIPYLLGEPHPLGKRLADVQKCLRTGDIDEVGDPYHHTFFQMLGNWSLGDYFKKEAIAMSFAFLTKELGIDKKRLAVSVFAGDKDAPFDQESKQAWLAVGIPEERIFPLGKKHNWWDAGVVGPGGPDSEIFIDTGKPPCGEDCSPACGCGKYVEIWNNVFIEYNRQTDGTYQELKQKNVDTGMGVARVVAILQGKNDNYQTELFSPIISFVEQLAGQRYGEETARSMRIIADHLRASVFIASEGVIPGKTDREYVLRRLARRAIREGNNLGIADNFVKRVAERVIATYRDAYPELAPMKDAVLTVLDEEEIAFRQTLDAGIKQFSRLAETVSGKLSGKQAFDLYQTYGFPWELTEEMAKEKGLSVSKAEFDREFKKHQEKSRSSSAGRFRGGLAEQNEQTARLHTATHLLNEALRQILGDATIGQRGSNITAERLRFDFNFSRKLTSEEVAGVEKLVNEQIKRDLPVCAQEVSLAEAKKRGAQAQFRHKYGERVTVYTIGEIDQPFSLEVCGGPHARSTGELGKFKIIKQESVGKGVRRIKAILEKV